MSETTSQPEQGPIDLPTGEPIPAAAEATSTPSSKLESSSSSSKPTNPLLALPSKTDAFLTHLQRCLATPSGTDTLLLFISYASRLAGALAASLSQSLLRRRLLAALALTLPRSSNHQTALLIATGKDLLPPRRAALAALAARLAARLKALAALASEARTIARLWALLGMYSWAKRLLLSPPPNLATTLVGWTQLLSCTAFQALENGAYLSSRNIMGWTPAQQARAYVVASRWLALYTGLEIGKLLATMLAAARDGGGVDEETEEAQEDKRKAMEGVRRSMAINLAWTPLTLHWAAETGFLSDLAVGLGGCVPGILQMRKLWRETAE